MVAHAIAVLHLSAQHIGDRFNAAVRMPGKPGYVVIGIIVAEVVHQQERVEGSRIVGTTKRAV